MAGTTSFEILQTSRLPNGRYIGICTVVQQSLQLLGPLPLISQRNNPVDAMISLFIIIYHHLKLVKVITVETNHGRFQSRAKTDDFGY